MSKAAMKLALEALEWCHGGEPCGTAEAIAALREALANEALDKMAENARELGLDYEVEPKIGCVNHDCDKCKALAEQPAQQEPWCMKMNGCKTKCEDCPDYVPPAAQRTWVGLTDEQKEILNFLLGASDINDAWFGDKHPTENGQFWWRNRLRKAFQDAAIATKLKGVE